MGRGRGKKRRGGEGEKKKMVLTSENFAADLEHFPPSLPVPLSNETKASSPKLSLKNKCYIFPSQVSIADVLIP